MESSKFSRFIKDLIARRSGSDVHDMVFKASVSWIHQLAKIMYDAVEELDSKLSDLNHWRGEVISEIGRLSQRLSTVENRDVFTTRITGNRIEGQLNKMEIGLSDVNQWRNEAADRIGELTRRLKVWEGDREILNDRVVKLETMMDGGLIAELKNVPRVVNNYYQMVAGQANTINGHTAAIHDLQKKVMEMEKENIAYSKAWEAISNRMYELENTAKKSEPPAPAPAYIANTKVVGQLLASYRELRRACVYLNNRPDATERDRIQNQANDLESYLRGQGLGDKVSIILEEFRQMSETSEYQPPAQDLIDRINSVVERMNHLDNRIRILGMSGAAKTEVVVDRANLAALWKEVGDLTNKVDVMAESMKAASPEEIGKVKTSLDVAWKRIESLCTFVGYHGQPPTISRGRD
jgi:chromosome segregation ATPase